jgi:biotin carboxylase
MNKLSTTSHLNIWFNRSYATAYWIMKQVKDNPDNVPVTVFASHIDPYSPTLQGADFAFVEPVLEPEDYLEWALEFCQTHNIDILIPKEHAETIAANVDRFNAIGVKVLTNNIENIDLFEDKAVAYESLASNGFPVPPYRTAKGSADFSAKLAELKATLEPDTVIIIKPVSGVGASGFRVINEDPYTVKNLISHTNNDITEAKILEALTLAEAQGEEVPALMIMPFLESPEISVDSLSTAEGKLVLNIPRTKDGSRFTRFSDRFPDANAIVKRLVEFYGLQYLTNTQLRWWKGELVILETNTRMSGGLYSSTATGVSVIWTAVKVLLGEDVGVIVPTLDKAYTSVSTNVIIDVKVAE